MVHGERATSSQVVRRGGFVRLLRRSVRGERVALEGYLHLLHRVTGVALVVYLFVHLHTLSSVLAGAQSFDAVMAAFNNPVVRLLELVLVVAVLFHTLNGIRLILLHLTPFRRSPALAWAVVVVPLVVGAASVRWFLR
ncbi:MAG TPA: succinate dehydrogenase, cytochrome b556 subunit [Limnochordales bacterium]